VLKVLRETKGNKKKASEILGIDRTTLYRILEKG
jgi:transcriptional regulator of acetoin/glycerol metabolism